MSPEQIQQGLHETANELARLDERQRDLIKLSQEYHRVLRAQCDDRCLASEAPSMSAASSRAMTTREGRDEDAVRSHRV